MENPLLDLGSGDMTADKPKTPELLKREQDSLDDFEHLDKDGKREDFLESPFHQQPEVARVISQSFLDNERDLFVDAPRAPSVDKLSDKLSDHLADKFTDSESDTAGESPMHRPLPPAHHDITLVDTTPLMKPAPAPQLPITKPSSESLIPEFEPLKPEPTKIPDPLPLKPEPAPFEPVKPVIKEPEAPKPIPEVKAPAKIAPEAPKSPPAHVIEAEVIFCRMGLDAWFDPQRLHPAVESLVYWRDPVKSGIALGSGLALLVALACCSVVSVLAYVSLLILSASVGFRIYKNVLQAVQKTNEGHPFKVLLETDISVPAERAQNLAAAATAHLNATTNELRRLFLVEDLVDSLKFGVLLWCNTYIGAYFNGITLIILAWLALFTLPKAYEMNKAQVDSNLEVARAKINEITNKVRAAVPLGRKSESEKDK